MSEQQNIQVPQKLENTLAEIAAIEIQIKMSKDQIKELRNQIKNDIRSILASCSADKVHKLASVLYWSEELSSPGAVKKAWKEIFNRGFSPSPFSTGFPCRRCVENIKVKSFSDLKHYRERIDDAYNFDVWPGAYCDQCSKLNSHDFQQKRNEINKRQQELQSMSYSDYLETPEWNEKRKQALKRARYHCQVCNNDGVLHVHHRTYENRGSEYASDLLVLCADCHEHFHLGDHSE